MVVARSVRWQPIMDQLGVACPGDIGWVHGANTRATLSAALSDPRVHFIEGDISAVGTKIIMAHPPITESDLAFETWLDLTVASGKGAKLDFKSADALNECLTYAAQHAVEKIPLCVNADVLPGPGGELPNIDPQELLSLSSRFLPQAFVSLGWTVGEAGGGYTKEMVAAMLELLVDVDAPVTFCFHAGYLRAVWPRVQSILEETDHTFTIWGMTDDASLLSWIRANAPPARCFYDMQRGDCSQIHLSSL